MIEMGCLNSFDVEFPSTYWDFSVNESHHIPALLCVCSLYIFLSLYCLLWLFLCSFSLYFIKALFCVSHRITRYIQIVQLRWKLFDN